MEPITLHFNVFQAGANSEGRKSLQVDDPRGTTVGALKRQLFSEALEARKSVRFITSGRILDDGARLEQCKLGQEAFIHVSISEIASSRAGLPELSGSGTAAGSGGQDMANPEPRKNKLAETKEKMKQLLQDSDGLNFFFFLGVLFFVGTGALLRYAWRKRWHLSMHMSQLLCILAAVWVYLVLCHGLPALLRALSRGVRALGRDDVVRTTRGDGPSSAAGCAAANSPMQAPATPPAALAASPPDAAGELRHRGVASHVSDLPAAGNASGCISST